MIKPNEEQSSIAKISIDQRSWNINGIPMSTHPKLFGQSSLRDHKEDQKWFFMSNMFECHIEYNGYSYECAEAAIQAQKYPGHEKEFKKLLYGKAKSYGRKYRARSDWRDISLGVLLEVVRAKFRQNPDIAKKLIQLQDMNPIVELNSWNDNFYGVVKDPKQPNVAIGSNCLGQALTIVRTELIAASVNTANTDGATTSGTGIPKASKGTSVAEAKNKVSKEETKMLVLKNKNEIIEKLGQKPIDPKADIDENNKLVARGAGLSDGFVADGEFIAPRLGVKPQVVATLDDNAASYTFDGKKLIVSDISKSAATYTGAVEIDPAATTASTVKKFVGASFKEVVSGGLIQTGNEIQKKVSTEREIYSVETLSGFSFAGFLSGDEDGFALSLEGAADWLAAAIKAGNANDKLIVKFGNTPAAPANNLAPSEPQQPEPTSTSATSTPEPAASNNSTSSKNKEISKYFENRGIISQDLIEFQRTNGSFNESAFGGDDDEKSDSTSGGSKINVGGNANLVNSFNEMTGSNGNGSSWIDDDDEEDKKEDNGGDWIDNGDEAEEAEEDREIVETGSEVKEEVKEKVKEKVKEEVKETFTLTTEDGQLINSWIVDNGDNTMRVKLNGDLKQPVGINGLQLTEWQKSTITLIRWFEKHNFKTYSYFTKTFCGTKRLQLETANVRLTFIQVKGDYDRQLPYFSTNGGQQRVYFDLDANRNFVFIQ